MTQPQQGFAIGVDLGTSNTVAVLRWPDGRTRSVLADGSPVMPSGVYMDESGRLHVGRDALRLAGLDPSRFEPNPKRRIDEAAVFLGDREIPTVDLLAAVLGSVGRAAVEAVGFLPPAVLTYPAAWGPRRRDTLAAAASRAGWPPVLMVPEPVAAARYFADVLRQPVPVGASIAVFDFGGGTLDIAVVRNEGGRFAVLGSGGIEDLGGLDIDAALVEYLGGVLTQRDAATWTALAAPQTTAHRRDRRLFWEDVRGAKEMLSRTTVAPIAVPGQDHAIHLTREELERVAEPLLRRAVWQTGDVIARCGLRPDQLAGLFLVGGSSRLPLAARLLHAQLGVPPTVLEQPELPVAEGALAEIAPSVAHAAPPVAPHPVSAAPAMQGMPGTPVSAAPLTPAPYSPAAPQSPLPPHSPYAAPSPLLPVAPAGPTSPAPMPVSPGFGHPHAAMGQAPPTGRRPWYRRPGVLAPLGAAAMVMILLVAVGAYFLRTRDQAREIEFSTLQAGMTVEIANGDKVDAAVSAMLGDRAYYGLVVDGGLQIGAVDIADSKKLWGPRAVDGKGTRWQMYALSNAVVVTADGSPGLLAVIDPESGRQRFRVPFQRSSDRAIFTENALVLYTESLNELRGVSWSDGGTKWSKPNPKSDVSSDAIVVPEGLDADLRGPANLTGTPTALQLSDDRRVIRVGSDKKITLIDAKGAELRSWNGLGNLYSSYVAHQGRLYVLDDASPYRVHAYDLSKAEEPQSIYSAPDSKRRLIDVSPCGENRLCVLDYAGSDPKTTEIAAIDVVGRKQVWRKPAPGTDKLIPAGDRILATNVAGSDAASVLFSADGNQLLAAEEQKAVGARVNGASLLFFTGTLSDYTSYDVSLVGVTADDGARTSLGTLSKTRGYSCSWNEQAVFCADAEAFRVSRFTA